MKSFDKDEDDKISWREFIEFIDRSMEEEKKLVAFL